MLPRWLPYLNVFLAVMIVSIISACFYVSFEPEIVPSIPLEEKKELPANPFAQSSEAYQELGEGLLTLSWVVPQMQLPDLKEELVFCGKNERPDVRGIQPTFHFMTRGHDHLHSVREGEKIYLVYQGSALRGFAKGSYILSENNQPTALWFEALSLDEHAVQIQVGMLDEKGALVTTPLPFHQFTLREAEEAKLASCSWNLGKLRADTTLLVRQRARWIGQDRFLEMHGGEEFSYVQGKERIDFFEDKIPYSCFVTVGDFLVWRDERWQVVDSKQSTQGLPLMVVKKIDDRLMLFELWDPQGRSKIALNLIHIKDHEKPLEMTEEFKFVGAKTWAQFLIECRGMGRLVLRTHDWLVHTQEGWKPLDSPELIDDFVAFRLTGPLFILDKLSKENGRQVLLGHLFNSTRTEMQEVKFIASGASSLQYSRTKSPEEPKNSSLTHYSGIPRPIEGNG